MCVNQSGEAVRATIVSEAFADWTRRICICWDPKNYLVCPKTHAFSYLYGWRKWGGPKSTNQGESRVIALFATGDCR